MRPNRRVSQVLLVLLFAAMINLPLAHSTFTRWRVERSGEDVTATVTDHQVRDSENLLEFTFPKEVDPDQAKWTAQVDHLSYDKAVTDGTIVVRVLPGHPSSYRAEGQVTGNVGLILTLFADLALVICAWLLLRYRGRLRPELRMVALEDVQRCPPGAVLDRIDGVVYEVCGEVTAVEDDEILLEVGERSVRVFLDGHANPVGHQQPARVVGRMVG
ncbi:hypothetical protein [Nocardioides sp.]|uniref:hypothetical protein n=1 Tax=Nocardioides sp. TaxID=35761 RepID=UPI0031FED372|nr:hypothetical protein [Nocardioides sp.]